METMRQGDQVTLVQTPASTPLQKSSKKKYVIICGGVILLLLFFAWFLFEFLRVQDIKKMSQTPKVGIVSTPTSSPLANWKTYKDSATGLTFQYPPEFQVITLTKGAQIIVGHMDQVGEYGLFINSPSVSSGSAYEKFDYNHNLETCSAALQRSHLPSYDFPWCMEDGAGKYPGVKDIVVAGMPAREFYITSLALGNVWRVIQFKNVPLQLIPSEFNSSTDTENVEKILKTMHFDPAL